MAAARPRLATPRPGARRPVCSSSSSPRWGSRRADAIVWRAAVQEAPQAEGSGEEGNGEEEYYDEAYYDYAEGEEEEIDFTRPFPAEIPMEPATKSLSAIPLAVYYPGVLALAAAAGFAGLAVGRGMPVSRESREVVAYATAAVAAGAVVAGGMQAKKVRDRAAVVDLFNALVWMDEPSELTKDDVKAVADKYGIDFKRDQLEGLVQIFGQYLEGVVPKGEDQLRGDEAGKVAAFKDALGLTDEEAAPAFIEVARRLSRAGWEIKDRQAQFEQRKAFQRLIYLSYAVLGDTQAALLLPWQSEFNLNDSQLFVARRDNARAVFVAHLKEAYGGELPVDRDALADLRAFQQRVRLLDDVAADCAAAGARAHVERRLAAAVAELRAPAKSRDVKRAIAELRGILDYSRDLQALAVSVGCGEGEGGLLPGLARPSLRGGEWDVETKRRDVREAYKAFLEDATAEAGAFTPEIEADARELASVLALKPKDASDARSEVAAGLYRRLLREEVTSKRIDAAQSPAQVLSQLVSKAGFSPEAAMELHKGLYRQKLTSLVAKKKLTEEDAADLARIRRVLCIPPEAANEAARATSGKVLEEALEDVFGHGVKPVTPAENERVEGAIKAMRMDRDVAKAVFGEVARQKLKAFAGQAVKDLQGDKRAAAQSLKRMVQFNSLVVTPLLETVAGTEAAKKELAEIMAKAAEAAKKEEAAKAGEAGAEASKEEDEKAAAMRELEEVIRKAKEAAKKEQEEEAAKAASSSSSTEAAAEAKPAEAEAEAKPADAEAEAKPTVVEADQVIEEGSAAEAAAASPADAEAKAAANAAAAAEAEAKRKAEEEAEAKRKAEERDPVKRVQKMIAASRGEFGEEEKKSQKEITLANDVDPKIRAELYKAYLMYSMQTDVVELPVGGVIRKRTSNDSRQQEMLRLQHLSELLGMNQFEVSGVHQDLSEQAFKAQAQDVLRVPGPVPPERTAYLADMAKQLALPQDKADKIIREVRTEMVGARAALEESGGTKWTVERVLEAHKEGVDVKKALEEPARRVLLRREMDKRLGDGKAEFDAKLLLEELPEILGVERKRVDGLLKELVGTRKRMLLVQAVSQHRQKRDGDAVTSLNNLISAYRAQPEAGGVGAVQWGEREELRELWGAYCGKVDDGAKRDELASLFGIPPEDRAELAAAAAAGPARKGGAAAPGGEGEGGEAEEEELFF